MNSIPLVCLHGSFGEGADWTDFAERSGRAEVHCPDLPAHGARFAEGVASFDALVTELGQDLPEQCDLVGYSLGGRLALGVALAFPDRIRSLILESASPGLPERERPSRCMQDDVGAVELATNPRAFLTSFWQAPLFTSFRMHPEFDTHCSQRIERAERSPQVLAQTFAALSPGRQPDYNATASALALPLLFVAGSLDAKYRGIGVRLASLVPGARFDVVDDAGHNTHFEQPERFAACTERFWESLS